MHGRIYMHAAMQMCKSSVYARQGGWGEPTMAPKRLRQCVQSAMFLCVISQTVQTVAQVLDVLQRIFFSGISMRYATYLQ